MGCVESSDALGRSKALEGILKNEHKNWDMEVKLLLLGPGESGKSTIFKQMKIIQDNGGFDASERQSFKSLIYSNTISQMRVILEAIAVMEIQLYSEDALQSAQKILSLPTGASVAGAWSPEIAEAIQTLWSDGGVREAFTLGQRRYQLNETADYFFDNIDRFLEENYIPTDNDILRVRARSTGIEEAVFYFDKTLFRVVDVGGQRSERRKWIHCFDSVTAVIFTASLSGYDQVLREDTSQNRMTESILLFDEVANSASFETKDIILFLNKYDLFEEKIQKTDLNVCFSNYTGGLNAETAKEFIKQRFIERTNSEVFVHFTTALDTSNIAFVITSVRQMILRRRLEKAGVWEGH